MSTTLGAGRNGMGLCCFRTVGLLVLAVHQMLWNIDADLFARPHP